MSFIIDKQSLDDLNLLGKYKQNSIYSIFNQVKTTGGEKLLESIFRAPLQDPHEINRRSATIRYFEKEGATFPFERETAEVAQNYLNDGAGGGRLSTNLHIFKSKVMQLAVRADQFERLQAGVKATAQLLRDFLTYIRPIADDVRYAEQAQLQNICAILDDARLKEICRAKGWENWSLWQLAQFHFLLGNTLNEHLKQVLQMLYTLDVYVSAATVSRERNLKYATAFPAEEGRLMAADLRHPALDKAIGNHLTLERQYNVLFLTGANMAGKSTLMKSIGTNLYLAHLGFPVAASRLEFSVMDGLYSSINVPDDIQKGYSHFFAEVFRVKEVALQVRSRKRLLVLFDELFKGTNVKDAYDATLAVTEAFARYTDCLFVISTHIIEVGEALGQRCDNIRFRFLPTVLEGTKPRYTYRLEEGITSDRQGMMIIQNEQILEIIRGEK